MRKLILFTVIFVSIFSFFIKQVRAVNPIDSVRVNPADFRDVRVGDVIPISALAFDQYGSAVHYGVTYDWGISSSGSIGQITADSTGKIATLRVIGEGQGDIYVNANDGTQQVTKSFQIIVVDGVSGGPTVCDADMDQSGAVNLADYTILAANFMKNPPINPQADIDGSGRVDLFDYSILARYFFQTCQR